jgi:superfamily I DNA/RNA helicase
VQSVVAGSGKTFTLRQLVKKIITDTAPNKPRILCSSFANEVTGELRNKLQADGCCRGLMVQTLSSIALEFVKRQYAAASVPVTAFINTDKNVLVNKFSIRTEVVATMPNNCREAAIKAEITKLLRFVQKTLTNFHNSADLVVSAKHVWFKVKNHADEVHRNYKEFVIKAAQKMYGSSVAFLHEHRPFNRSSDVSFTHDTYMKLMQLTMIHDELAAPLYNIAMDSESRYVNRLTTQQVHD